MHIAINHLYKDRIYRQASKSCNSPNLFNLENQRLLFEILKRSMNECSPRWLLHKAFMYLVSRHQHSCCMTWLLPNQHLTIRLMMVEMVNICFHSINSNMWMLENVFRKQLILLRKATSNSACQPTRSETHHSVALLLYRSRKTGPLNLAHFIFTILAYRSRKPVEQMMQ